MADEVLLNDLTDGVAVITLNRPGALNAFDRRLRSELLAAIEGASSDPRVGAVLIQGAGRAFSVGQDIGELERIYDSEGPVLGTLVEEEYVPLLGAMRTLTKPVVAAVHGPAAGGGLALALAADVRLASETASFTAAFVKVGLVPDSGASFHLVRMLGLSKAMEVTLLGEPIRAEEAMRLGIVRSVHPDRDALMAAAMETAKALAAGPQLAYSAIRDVLNAAAAADFEEVVALEIEAQDRLGRTRDHQEALRAFREKRPPRFEGR